MSVDRVLCLLMNHEVGGLLQEQRLDTRSCNPQAHAATVLDLLEESKPPSLLLDRAAIVVGTGYSRQLSGWRHSHSAMQH